MAASQPFTAAQSRLSKSSCGPRAVSGPPLSWTICLPSSMERGSRSTTVTVSSVTDSSSWRAAACSGVSSAVSSVLTSSSFCGELVEVDAGVG